MISLIKNILWWLNIYDKGFRGYNEKIRVIEIFLISTNHFSLLTIGYQREKSWLSVVKHFYILLSFSMFYVNLILLTLFSKQRTACYSRFYNIYILVSLIKTLAKRHMPSVVLHLKLLTIVYWILDSWERYVIDYDALMTCLKKNLRWYLPIKIYDVFSCFTDISFVK